MISNHGASAATLSHHIQPPTHLARCVLRTGRAGRGPNRPLEAGPEPQNWGVEAYNARVSASGPRSRVMGFGLNVGIAIKDADRFALIGGLLMRFHVPQGSYFGALTAAVALRGRRGGAPASAQDVPHRRVSGRRQSTARYDVPFFHCDRRRRPGRSVAGPGAASQQASS